jgi:acylphosphatase
VERRWVRVSGGVQGVGYRMFTQEVANNLDVSGWVRNDSDGSVECEAQAKRSVLEQFVTNLQQGPCFSSVQRVEHQVRPCVGKEKEFHIRY